MGSGRTAGGYARDNSPMRHVVGGSLPAMIWQRFMTEATILITQE